jgi:hypothetical protein
MAMIEFTRLVDEAAEAPAEAAEQAE